MPDEANGWNEYRREVTGFMTRQSQLNQRYLDLIHINEKEIAVLKTKLVLYGAAIAFLISTVANIIFHFINK